MPQSSHTAVRTPKGPPLGLSSVSGLLLLLLLSVLCPQMFRDGLKLLLNPCPHTPLCKACMILIDLPVHRRGRKWREVYTAAPTTSNKASSILTKHPGFSHHQHPVFSHHREVSPHLASTQPSLSPLPDFALPPLSFFSSLFLLLPGTKTVSNSPRLLLSLSILWCLSTQTQAHLPSHPYPTLALPRFSLIFLSTKKVLLPDFKKSAFHQTTETPGKEVSTDKEIWESAVM